MPTRESLKARVEELHSELAKGDAQLREMEEGERLEALVKVRNFIRGFKVTPEDLCIALMPKLRGWPRKAAP